VAERHCIVVRRHDTSVACAYKYARWIYRVVECGTGQRGYLNERGVKLIHQSAPLTYSGGPKDRAARAECERIAALGNRALAVSLTSDAPEYAIMDREQEMGVTVAV
jgi:hypothetical protein